MWATVAVTCRMVLSVFKNGRRLICPLIPLKMAYKRLSSTTHRHSECAANSNEYMIDCNFDSVELLCKAPYQRHLPLGQMMDILGLFNPSAEFRRCHTFVFFEQSCEIGLIVYAHFRGYFANGELGLGEQYFSFQYNRLVDPLGG